MKKAFVEAWLLGLRSGKYKQHTGSLCSSHKGSNKLYEADAHCCIGVAGVVNNVPPIEYIDTGLCARYLGISHEPRHQFGMPDQDKLSDYEVLINMNDREHKSFSEIADWIEQNILPNATE